MVIVGGPADPLGGTGWTDVPRFLDGVDGGGARAAFDALVAALRLRG